MKTLFSIATLSAASFLIAGTAPPAVAAEGDKPDQPAPVADGDQDDKPDMQRDEDSSGGGADLAREWLDRLRNLGRRNPNERNHEKVLAAFKEITSPASHSTALIFSGDKPAAFGTVVDKDGYILTKASELAKDLSCRLRDGRHLPATVVGVHADNDLAMLKIAADDLKPITWQAEGKPLIGSWLATSSLEDHPLGIGVASVDVRRIRPTPGVLGVQLEDGDGGAKIAEVMRRGAAEKAGVKNGDIVLSVNGKETKDREALVKTIREHFPGDVVKLKIRRGDEDMELSATLGSNFPQVTGRGEFQNRLGGSLSDRRAGFVQAIQHDTVLEPHECGGPVLDLDGKAVGINIARAGRVASYALPAELILAVVDDLKSGKLAPKEPSETIDRLAELEREIQQMTKAINNGAAQQADAKKKLDDAKASVEKLEEQLKAAQAAREAARQAAAAAEAAVSEMQEQLKKLETEREKLEAK